MVNKIDDLKKDDYDKKLLADRARNLALIGGIFGIYLVESPEFYQQKLMALMLWNGWHL